MLIPDLSGKSAAIENKQLSGATFWSRAFYSQIGKRQHYRYSMDLVHFNKFKHFEPPTFDIVRYKPQYRFLKRPLFLPSNLGQAQRSFLRLYSLKAETQALLSQ